MPKDIAFNFLWWVTFVDLPAMAGLFLLIWRTRRENEHSIRHLQDLLETRTSQMREGLYAYKLEVAKSYARTSDMQALEDRLIAHLLRIEAKLDSTALKAEALKAEARLITD